MITNKHDLPEAFLKFEEKNTYDSGGADYSVTTLIDSPKINYLKKIHSEEITEDLSGKVFSMLGTAVHNILELGAGKNDIAEKRFFALIDGMNISGQIDLMELTEPGPFPIYGMRDYKTIRGSSLVYNPEGKIEWVKQLNLYRLLCHMNGYKISDLQVIAVVRDWNAASVRRDSRFPPQPVVRVPIEMWSIEETFEYARERIALHKKEIPDNCSNEERWRSDDVYAVHEYSKDAKKGLKKRATRLLDTSYDAESYIIQNGLKAEVLIREGKSVRCDGNYCLVADFCEQYQKEKDNY